ncbi:diacylglycerol/lipid kinase family protein [Candidatus Methylacidithermus pantelleriae]|uniref:diacylglycerol/lipid kinase family protein n=1 Tax=Candidatus Methylacidithermus pantelleriae TaxID=2744239 RepID=UPI001BD24653|nr:diacylglycerol kinase family protein [Candidatus Methylacidithermus pantelleriae]
MIEPVCIIFNPAARGQKAGRLYRRLQTIAPEAQIYCTEKTGDARSLAKLAVEEGYPLIVAAGGDGTVNEVVNGVAGNPVVLGVLPLGTVNVVAWELGIPRQLEVAWKVVRQGTTRRLDLGRANGRYFVQMFGAGLDAQALQRTSAPFRRTFGPASYVVHAIRISLERRCPTLVIESCGRVRGQGAFLLVGNGRFYGGPFRVFPTARPDDGVLDVCLFEKADFWPLLRYASGVLSGRHPHVRGVSYFPCRDLRVASHGEVPYQVDGEVAGSLPCRVEVLPSSLQVRVGAR